MKATIIVLAATTTLLLHTVVPVHAVPIDHPPSPLAKTPEATVAVSVGVVNLNVAKATSGGAQDKQVVFSKEINVADLQQGKDSDFSRLVLDPELTKLRTSKYTSRAAGSGWGIDLPGDVLRITSLEDGHIQYLNAETLVTYGHRSAYFNGGRLRVELLVEGDAAHPTTFNYQDQKVFETANAEGPSFVISGVLVNPQEKRLPPPNSLCNADDKRTPIRDLRAGRIHPIGCTGWLIDDKNGCQFTAGHCFNGIDISKEMLELNVPNSDANGNVKHPAPEWQFPIDAASAIWKNTNSEDYAYYGTFKNSNTGQTAKEKAGATYKLAKVNKVGGNDYEIDPAVGVKPGATIRVTGYGTVSTAGKKHLSQTEQTHAGPLVAARDKYHLRHRADTTGGNSGSAITISETWAIGIHTDGGCVPGNPNSSNAGASIAMPGIHEALANPKGVCK